MADPNMNKTPEEMKNNETMQREQAKAELDKNRQPEQGSDKERDEKSAIGGGQTSQSEQSSSGQQSGQQFDKSREPTSR